MTCELCTILLNKQRRLENLSASLEHLKASGEEGCEGCRLVVESIEHFFWEDLHQELEPNTSWKVTPGWLQRASWKRGIGAISLSRSEHLDDPEGVSALDICIGTVYMYCLPGQSPQSMDIPVRLHNSRNTSSDSAHRLTKSWLDECCLNHSGCADPQLTKLPKRTVFLGSNNSEIFLSENKGAQSNQYACLSHCWGKIQPLRTTSQTIARHKRAIPWDDLPKTFQDAIVFSRYLGISHIWIDSLCIIQDDDDDWVSESTKMSSIYSGAVVTIAAMASKDGSEGCFRTDDREPFEFQLTDAGQSKVFSTLGSHEGQIHRTRFPPNAEPQEESPLRGRGWVFQETFLSRRIIYFHKYEIAWECRRQFECECGIGKSSKIIERYPQNPWEVFVADYSGRALSNSKDKLPALSGVANIVLQNDNRFHTVGNYYGGLWERDLVDQLCWGGRTATSLSRSSDYRAPTWSWASVDGQVFYYPAGPETPIYRAEVASVACTLATVDPYGQISRGYLDLATLVLPATYHDHFEIEMMTGGEDPSSSVHFDRARIDVNPYFKQTRQPPFFPDLRCALLRYGKEEWWRRSGNVFRLTVLLLEPSDGDQQSYKRIGAANGYLSKEQWVFLRGLLANGRQIIRII